MEEIVDNSCKLDMMYQTIHLGWGISQYYDMDGSFIHLIVWKIIV